MDYLVTAKKSYINIFKDMEKWPFWQIKWQKQDLKARNFVYPVWCRLSKMFPYVSMQGQVKNNVGENILKWYSCVGGVGWSRERD